MAYETITTIANTAARPGSPEDGMIRYQQDIQSCIIYDDGASAWKVFTPDDAPYDLDGTNILTVTPNFHFDADQVNGVDDSDNPDDASTFDSAVSGGSGGYWTSRTNGVKTIPQTTASYQPTYYTTGENSQPYFSTDGGDKLQVKIFNENCIGDDSQPFTIFGFMDGLSNANNIVLGDTFCRMSVTPWDIMANNGSLAMHYGPTDVDFVFSPYGFDSASRPVIDDGAGGTAAADYVIPRMFIITRDGSNDSKFYVDGNNRNTSLTGTGTRAPKWDYLFQSDISYKMTGRTYELAFWNSLLSDADLNTLITYVNTRYGAGKDAPGTGTLARATF